VRPEVSVPYSSGQPWQQRMQRSTPNPTPGFSPLFVGAAVATRRIATWLEDFDHVSVPYSSGQPWQRRERASGNRDIRGFSPLFVGAAVATLVETLAAWQAAHRFSPLFVGAAVATNNDFRKYVRIAAVSVPYSSGQPWQPYGTGERQTRRRRRFSPLFVGAAVATRGRQ